MKQQVTVGVLSSRIARHHEPVFFAIEGSKINSILFAHASAMVGREIEEMFSIGEKPGPAMSGVLLEVHFGGRLRVAALGADAHERRVEIRGINNDIVFTPTAAAAVGRVGQSRGGSAGGRDLVDL